MISVVIITRNEAKELIKCLESVKDLADEIVLVNLESEDNTLEVAKEFKAKVIEHEAVPYADPIRNWAISKATKDWVLALDPDEVVPNKLKEVLRKLTMDKHQGFVAVNIPFKNIFFGRWIAHTNFWPDKHVRFFKFGHLIYSPNVHTYPRILGATLELPNQEDLAIRHYGYSSIGQFFQKQINYSKIEARNRIDAGEGFSILRLLWMPLREFLARYIKHQGFKDGWVGFCLVVGLMMYQVLVQVNILAKKAD